MQYVLNRIICFFTVAENNNSNGYKFYGNTKCVTTIFGNGDIDTKGLMKSVTAQTTGNSTVGGDLTVNGFFCNEALCRLLRFR